MQSILNPDSLIQKAPTNISELEAFPWTEILQGLVSKVVTFCFHLVIAVLVFYAGKFVIGKLHAILKVFLQRRNIEPSLATFLLSLLKITLMFILIVSVVGIIGIETSSFIALFASAGVAVGMALSGTLQNFAGGVLILLLKPFKVGDYIVFGSNMGVVREIQIFHTIITTNSNERIVIPNGGLSTGVINNFSSEKYRRVEWKVSIAYGSDIDKARKVILGILADDERIIHEPDANICPVATAPFVAVSELGGSDVVLVVRAWVDNSVYWDVKFAIGEEIYKRLPKEGLEFPFPQLDVNIKK
ncbi:MAG: mechanosensitive ion channel [Sodaliphilus sp.]|nr:mechanosensitive ion channel [Sodaliphilus sp.]